MLIMDLQGWTLMASFQGIADSLTNPHQRELVHNALHRLGPRVPHTPRHTTAPLNSRVSRSPDRRQDKAGYQLGSMERCGINLPVHLKPPTLHTPERLYTRHRRSLRNLRPHPSSEYACTSCYCKMTYSSRHPFQAPRWLRFARTDVAGTWGPSMQAFCMVIRFSLAESTLSTHLMVAATYGSRRLHSFGFHIPPSNNPLFFGAPNSSHQSLFSAYSAIADAQILRSECLSNCCGNYLRDACAFKALPKSSPSRTILCTCAYVAPIPVSN